VSIMDALAVIMAGGRGTRLGMLSQTRAKPAVPVAGKYRIIDFVLSNCANSGISTVGILTQYRHHSLYSHVRTGAPWGLDRRPLAFENSHSDGTPSGGVTLLPPRLRNSDGTDGYSGTADAVYKNLDFVLCHETNAVLVLSSDHVYKMDYTLLLQYHHRQQADVTIGVIDVPLEQASRFGILVADNTGRVLEFQEKPLEPRSTMASMGIYVFRTDVLAQRLTQDAHCLDSDHDFGKNVLPRMLAMGDRIYAYRFKGYWMDVGTVQSYWKANMDFLSLDPPLDLLDPQWNIYTRSESRPPANIHPDAAVSNSIITAGCVIEGQVASSVLSPGVHVGAGAIVRDSVILSDCEIGPGAVVEQAILDKNVVVGGGGYVGLDLNNTADHRSPAEINDGLALVGENAYLPAGL